MTLIVCASPSMVSLVPWLCVDVLMSTRLGRMGLPRVHTCILTALSLLGRAVGLGVAVVMTILVWATTIVTRTRAVTVGSRLSVLVLPLVRGSAMRLAEGPDQICQATNAKVSADIPIHYGHRGGSIRSCGA